MPTFDARVLVERFTTSGRHRGDPIDVYPPKALPLGTRCPSHILLHITGIPSNYPTVEDSFREFEAQITGPLMDPESPNLTVLLRNAKYRFRLGMVPNPQRQGMIDAGGIEITWTQARNMLGFKVINEADRLNKLADTYIDVGDNDL